MHEGGRRDLVEGLEGRGRRREEERRREAPQKRPSRGDAEGWVLCGAGVGRDSLAFCLRRRSFGAAGPPLADAASGALWAAGGGGRAQGGRERGEGEGGRRRNGGDGRGR